MCGNIGRNRWINLSSVCLAAKLNLKRTNGKACRVHVMLTKPFSVGLISRLVGAVRPGEKRPRRQPTVVGSGGFWGSQSDEQLRHSTRRSGQPPWTSRQEHSTELTPAAALSSKWFPLPIKYTVPCVQNFELFQSSWIYITERNRPCSPSPLPRTLLFMLGVVSD